MFHHNNQKTIRDPAPKPAKYVDGLVWICKAGIEVKVGKSNIRGATENKIRQENEEDNAKNN